MRPLLLLLLLLTVPLMATAQQRLPLANNVTKQQNGEAESEEEDPCVTPDDHRNCWTQDPITGIRHSQVPDTTHLDLATRQTMVGQSLALLTTGNLYAPHHITDFFDQRDASDFIFVNAYDLFRYRPEDALFFDTRIPFTRVGYTTSGSSSQSNDRLRLDFAGNVNKHIGIGSFLDYVYARGEFVSESTKPLKWTSYAYYDTDQYKATLTFNISKLANQENGGIQDRSYVLTPDLYDNSFTTPRTMPTNLDGTWNDTDSRSLHFNHSYDLGMWDEVTNPDDSTDVSERFTSVASIFHSIDFETFSHQFRMDDNADLTDNGDYYAQHYINDARTCDSTQYTDFSTCAGIRINEGFSRWSQFGLAAFIGYHRQSYTMMQDSLDLSFISRRHASNNLFVGGQLSRHQSSYLTFDVTAKVGLTGDKAGDIDITGQLQTVIPAGKDSITVQASGYFRNQNVSYLMNHYFSNHFKWDEDFNAEQRLRLEGKLCYSLTSTEAKVGIEHISNYHYFDATDYMPHESSDMVELFSLELTQKLHWRALHFDNTVLLQTTTQDEVLPLPKVAWHSDLSLHFVIAHSLTMQLGCSGYYYTKYYAPAYQPATQQFAVQRDYKCGNYTTFNAYANCNLKRIKFYIMYSGFGTQTISNDAFHMPLYPMQSTRVEYGVIFDLQN